MRPGSRTRGRGLLWAAVARGGTPADSSVMAAGRPGVERWWNEAAALRVTGQVGGEPTPGPAGTRQDLVVRGPRSHNGFGPPAGLMSVRCPAEPGCLPGCVLAGRGQEPEPVVQWGAGDPAPKPVRSAPDDSPSSRRA